MKYRNFIFDMGNVILDFSPDYLLSKSTHDMNVIRTLKQELFYSGLWHKLDNDEVSLTDIKSIVIEKIPKEMHSVLDSFLKDWSLNLKTNEKMVNLIIKLKEKGYKIYLCSNAPSFFSSYNSYYQVLDLFDGAIFSGEIGISKPDPQIFKYLLDKFDLRSEECFFIDDLSINVQAALKVGIDGYRYNGNQDLFENFLKNISVL